jgi:hypothetical protein
MSVDLAARVEVEEAKPHILLSLAQVQWANDGCAVERGFEVFLWLDNQPHTAMALLDDMEDMARRAKAKVKKFIEEKQNR